MDQSATLSPTRFLGCDVGKQAVVVHDTADGRTRTLPNTARALARFVASLDASCLVVCEATGGYEAQLLAAAAAAGIGAHRADARRVKAFIRSLGTLGKTDALDALALAQYGRERHRSLPLWRPREASRERLHRLVQARSDLVRDRTAYSNRLIAPGADPAAPHLQRVLAALNAGITGLEAEIRKLIKSDASLAEALAILCSIKGLGATTAAALIALLPELGTLDRRQIAALAGLAPHPRQSGKADGYRRTRGGRPEVKRALFMATLAAARFNPILKAFYQRLRGNGKKPLVAIVATMRKLITIANAKIRDSHLNQLS